MYVPPLYRPPDVAAQHELITENPFGLLVVAGGGALSGVHLPFVLDREQGPYGRLRGHLSRANPVAAALAEGTEVMAVFTGPHSYICPDDYASEPHFPTWNYAAVHAYGRPRVLAGAEADRQLVDLIADQEGRLAPKEPWTLDRVPDELYQQFRSMIVVFELPLDRLEGIFKYGQNKERDDLCAQVRAFRRRGTDSAHRFADRLAGHNDISGARS
ncbi:FMN-binding negative transcriptional regulator [Actinoplanes sp. NPDC049548]|uniref:FMN-binding negative transcriptional regulator n=1 Tax=Actinoplanes sp. NPDC049548 TaxID=3155152 RepID=UPI0034343E86